MYDIISPPICIFYTVFKLNISRTNADIANADIYEFFLLIFCGILCDTPKKSVESRGKNLAIAAC